MSSTGVPLAGRTILYPGCVLRLREGFTSGALEHPSGFRCFATDKLIRPEFLKSVLGSLDHIAAEPTHQIVVVSILDCGQYITVGT